jgi:methyl-accepting chemotaxis protein
VADEVRSLAGRSATAAKETSDMIEKSMGRVEEGVAKSIETNEALKKIVEVTAGVSEVISNIANISNEQAEEISKIQNNIEIIYVSASNNSASVQSNAAVSEELSSQANMLMSLVERFKINKKW